MRRKADPKIEGSMSERGAYMSLVDVARLMGFHGKPRNVARRALAKIRAKEAKIKKPILLPRVGENGGIRYIVARWTLKKRMPELFPRRDEIGERFNVELESLRDQVAEQASVIDCLGLALAELKREVVAMRQKTQNAA